MTDSTAVPVMNHGWTFKGWRAFLEDWIADGRLKRAILADFFDRLSAFGRTVSGLCDRVRCAPREPIRPSELAEIRRTLQQLDETIDLYALSAAAIDAAALAGRRAYGLLAADDEGPAHPPFQHMHSYVVAECRRLELPADLIVRADKNPEVHYVSTKLGQLADSYRRAAKDESGHAVTTTGELAQARAELDIIVFEGLKLQAVVGMCWAMIDEARRALGLDREAVPAS